MIPSNWAATTLGEIADIQLGKMLDAKKNRGTPLPYLRNINVRWHKFETTDLLQMRFEDHELERYGIRRGDVLVCEGGEPGRCAIWASNDSTIKYQKALHRVRLASGVLPEWLTYRLYFDAQHNGLVEHFTGTTIKHLPREALLEYVIGIAPTREQHRIVEAIESYFTRLDDAVATLERVQRNLKRYRASVLNAAVEGRLVPTEAELACAEGRDYEPASVLLERILAERRRRWEETELGKMKAAGKAPKGDTWKSKYEEPALPPAPALQSLPSGWEWSTVDVLHWAGDYGTSQKCHAAASGPPVLRIPNIENGSFTFGDVKYATTDELPADGVLRPGDFVFIRTNGSKSLIGRGAVVVGNFEREYYFASYLIRLRLAVPLTTAKWFELIWNSPIVRNQLLKDAASSAGQHNVSLSAARHYLLPIPPLAEQQRILSKVDELFSVGESAQAETIQARARLSALRQSILKWAFEGRLVDQDPTDEPASVLLERIRAERGAAAAKKPAGSRKRKT